MSHRTSTAAPASAAEPYATRAQGGRGGVSDEQKLREYLRRVTGELRRAHLRVRELEQRRREPIAIVGMSCRYPGGGEPPEELWQLVARRRDAISELPTDRGWDLERLYDPDPDRPRHQLLRARRLPARHRGVRRRLLRHRSARGAGDGPAAAAAAGSSPGRRWKTPASIQTRWRAAATGVFAGALPRLRAELATRGASSELESDLRPVSSTSFLCGRVAYLFGLQGPAMAVDTACSSSLVAMHLACQALRRGECSMALAGGVTVMSHPTMLTGFGRVRGSPPTGGVGPSRRAPMGRASRMAPGSSCSSACRMRAASGTGCSRWCGAAP